MSEYAYWLAHAKEPLSLPRMENGLIGKSVALNLAAGLDN